ncbi:MAG: 3-deoxy-7-phosphoheptulonate synthase [Spirochaetaceae bacterium]|nr:3-deoxy-7-phosphoheptulonate synthase [Spirochaetaceae bacterium]
MPRDIYNVNIESQLPLLSPSVLKNALPVDDELALSIVSYRDEVIKILNHDDDRFLIIVGPCSIHDPDAAMEYARRLSKLRDRYAESLCIVMRVYFEKPRTSLGWRGLIIDPYMDGTYNIHEGLREARRLLIEINRLGLPAGTEVLDPIIPQYIADLISWSAIGARTTESQTHREISSGLSMAVGFKNGTDGNLTKAANAVQSAQHGHSFIGIDQDGRTCIFNSRGNRTGHIIMRGGSGGPNYYEEDIEKAEDLLSDIGVKPSVIVDCSHANSGKKHSRQSRVFRSVLDLRNHGRNSLRGVMLESNLMEGRQDLTGNLSTLKYGQSITDACIGWDETEDLISRAAYQGARN